MGKWELWNFFASDETIRPYLPSTAMFSEHTLRSYLAMYPLVFVKPDNGRGGRGVVKIWRTKEGYTFIRERGRIVRCRTMERLYRKIKQDLQPGKRYVIQEGVRLAKINGRPFDIRLAMMRKSGRWEAIGMLAKVAGPNSAVTNIARGKGYVTGVRNALKKALGLRDDAIDVLQDEMKEVGYRIGEKFDEFRTYEQIGLDFAVDRNGKLWVIEENIGSSRSLFVRLKDKSVYRKMRSMNTARRRRKPQ
ncbi:YheC/YheD family protein [Aneurinibacillus danicus]|jgi:hypothetical protein|uniref:ATP-grasp domain-containing protein n=1 Tax=Aneurinibacillus danicus TaxID=267746 RepID=A0A511V3Q6_9BACL|nr:YheC/YheD family protein [Aneurinibacillus danicus]GEN33534.1 hypothetical protein ADA01nite_09940 [Aneurinibacillus danicus]